jgi:hypothetical protein
MVIRDLLSCLVRAGLRAAPNLAITVPTTIDTSGLTLNGITSPPAGIDSSIP